MDLKHFKTLHALAGIAPLRAPDDLVALPTRGRVVGGGGVRRAKLRADARTPPMPLVQKGTGLVTLQARVAGEGGLVVYVTRDRDRVQSGDLVVLLLPRYTGVVEVVRVGGNGLPEATRAVGAIASNFALLRYPQVNRLWVYVHAGRSVSVGVGENPGQFPAAAASNLSKGALRYVSFAADHHVHGEVWNVQSWAHVQ